MMKDLDVNSIRRNGIVVVITHLFQETCKKMMMLNYLMVMFSVWSKQYSHLNASWTNYVLWLLTTQSRKNVPIVITELASICVWTGVFYTTILWHLALMCMWKHSLYSYYVIFLPLFVQFWNQCFCWFFILNAFIISYQHANRDMLILLQFHVCNMSIIGIRFRD